MKKILKSAFITCSIVFAMSALTSCGEDGPIDPTKDYQEVKKITAEAGGTVEFEAKFSEAEKKMYRLYVSQNVYGSETGTVAYDILKQSPNADLKTDGSFDLKSDEKESVSRILNLKAPAVDGGVTVYKIWVTGGGAFSSSKGDFRDTKKNNAYGANNAFITVIITAGTPNVTAKGLKTFSATILSAPLADGSSKSFMSVYNGQVYAIKGAKESAALWDFGYYYGSTDKATFVAVPKSTIINVSSISGIPNSDLNEFFIKRSTLSFGASVADINGISKPSTQKVPNLKANDVLEFWDAYGTKGLIKIKNIAGTNGTSGKITFDVKVQDLSVTQ